MNASQDKPEAQCAGSGPGREQVMTGGARGGGERGFSTRDLALAMVAAAAVLVGIGLSIKPHPKGAVPTKATTIVVPLPVDPQHGRKATAPSPAIPVAQPFEPPEKKISPFAEPRKAAKVEPVTAKGPAPVRPPVIQSGKAAVTVPLNPRPAPVAPPLPPVVQPPAPPNPRPSAAPLGDQFTIDVYSRIHPIVEGSSFPVDDSVLGQLADGDLKAQVAFAGAAAPKGRFTLEWQLDGISPGAKPAPLNQVVEYNAEPTVGTYRLVLRLDKTVLKTFTFRISPARRSPANKERLP